MTHYFAQNDYESLGFKNLELPIQQFSGKEFSNCSFSQCNFNETAFLKCKFRLCTFKDCDLNLVHLEGCSFMNTHFEFSRLMGINWAITDLNQSKLTSPLKFTNCVLNYSTFMGLNLKKLEIVECVARDVDFSEANLCEADFKGTDFTGSRFWHTDLTGADLSKAKNYTIPAHLNTLKKTKFSFPEAMSLLYNLDIDLLDE